MKIANDNPKLSFLLSFCHSCESRNPVLVFVACEKEKTTTLDPRLQTSRMTEGEMSRMTEGKEGEGGGDYRRFRSAGTVTGT